MESLGHSHLFRTKCRNPGFGQVIPLCFLMARQHYDVEAETIQRLQQTLSFFPSLAMLRVSCDCFLWGS